MGNIQKLNISLLKDQKNKFNNEKDSFYHSSYQIFNSSYLKNCSDFYVVSMKNNLEQLYSRIQNGYTNISKWLNEYCETYESLEDVLSQNRSAGSIINNNIRNYVSSKLSLLEDFDLHKGITRISVETSSSIGFNASTVIDEFADLYSDFQTKKEGITSKVNSGIEILQEKTGAVIHSAQSSITNGITDAANALDTKRKDLMDWWSNQAKPWIDSTANKIGETVKRTDATVTTFRVSLVEGVMHFGEAIVDLGAIVNSLSNTSGAMIADGVQSIYGKVTGNEWTSVTETMWDKTKTFVAEEHVTGWFDNLYQDTSYGQYLQENSYGFETTRSIGDGIGYIAGVTCLSIATFGVGGAAVAGTSTASSAAVTGGIAVTSSQTALIAGLAGVGKGTEKAWNDGASTTQGLAYGALNGVWEGTQYYLGSKIGTADGFGSKIASKILGTSSSNVTKQLVTSASRIMLDGIDGGVEGFVQPLLSMTYKEGSYKELFNENGGWSYVATNAVTGAGFSLLGELGDISRFIKDNNSKNIDVKIETNLKNADDLSNKINIVSEQSKIKVENNISEIEDQILMANYRSKKGMFATINLNSLDDISLDMLKKVEDTTDIKFNVDGKIYTCLQLQEYLSNTTLRNYAEKLNNVVTEMNLNLLDQLQTDDSIYNFYKNIDDINYINQLGFTSKQEAIDEIVKNADNIFQNGTGAQKVALCSNLDVLKKIVDNDEYQQFVVRNADLIYDQRLIGLYKELDSNSVINILNLPDIKRSIENMSLSNFEKMITNLNDNHLFEYDGIKNRLNNLSYDELNAVFNNCSSYLCEAMKYDLDIHSNSSFSKEILLKYFDKNNINNTFCNYDYFLRRLNGEEHFKEINSIIFENVDECFKKQTKNLNLNQVKEIVSQNENQYFSIKYVKDGVESFETMKLNNGNLLEKLRTNEFLSNITDIKYYKALNQDFVISMKDADEYALAKIRVAGKEKTVFAKKSFVNSSGNSIDMTSSILSIVKNIDDFELIDMKSISLSDISVPIDGTYKIKYDINGKNFEAYLSSKNKVLNWKDYVLKYEKVGAQNITYELSETKYKISEIYKNIFNEKELGFYGGDQSNYSNLLLKQLEGTDLTDLERIKVDSANCVVKKYFPNATDEEILKLSETYAHVGCNYMSMANATMSIMENFDAHLFKEKFGFDMYTIKDGVRYYNFEALAMDMFLNRYSGNTMDQVFLNAQGVSNHDFIDVYSNYFENKGINLEASSTSRPMDNYFLLKEDENVLDFALNHQNKNEIIITTGSSFDMQELFFKENNESLSDAALSNSHREGNILRNIGGHATTLTGFDMDGNYIVSSWGNKYLIPKDSASKLNLMSVKLSFKN